MEWSDWKCTYSWNGVEIQLSLKPSQVWGSWVNGEISENWSTKINKNEILDFNRLNEVFEEIAAVVNSRPLNYVASALTSSEQEIML